MTKDEKDSVDTETSQMDIPVDSQPRVEHEGQQNQPTENLPQQSAQSEASGSQAGTGEHAEDVNIIEQENEDLIEELPSQSSPEVERCSPETEPHPKVTNRKSWRKTVMEFCLMRFNHFTNDMSRFIFSFTVTSASLVCGTISETREYKDFALSIFSLSVTIFILSWFERGIFYSKVTKFMADKCPCIPACCTERQAPRRLSQFYRDIETDSRFDHEVADTSSSEMPRMVFRNEESDFSHSTERPESPKVVNVDVYGNVEASGYSEGGASGYATPVEGGASGYTTPVEGSISGYMTPLEGGASVYTTPVEGGAPRHSYSD